MSMTQQTSGSDTLTVAINVWLSNGWVLDHRSDPHAFLHRDFQTQPYGTAGNGRRCARVQLTAADGTVTATHINRWTGMHHTFKKCRSRMQQVLASLPEQTAEESPLRARLAEIERLYHEGTITHDEWTTVREQLIAAYATR